MLPPDTHPYIALASRRMRERCSPKLKVRPS